jgi:RNA polymerase sigma-70 factor (ECF subfamily)
MIRALFRYLMKLRELSPNAGASPGEVKMLLRRAAQGESAARDELIEAIYPELKRLAELRMGTDGPAHTLEPAALVNELFLEIAREQATTWRTRAQFLAVASQAMRGFFSDYAGAHRAPRSRVAAVRLQLADFHSDRNAGFDVIEIGEMLDRLASEEPRMARVVELRCFGGMTHAEIAEILQIDERTAKRDWQVARAWLSGKLRKSAP